MFFKIYASITISKIICELHSVIVIHVEMYHLKMRVRNIWLSS